MRKLIGATALLALMMVAFAGAAEPGNAAPRPTALAGNIAIDYHLLGGDTWSHLYTIDRFDPATGAFSGTGHYIPDPSYTEIITGTLQGNVVTFHILYTGTNANYTVDAMGTVDACGQLAGIAASPGQGFTWTGTRAPQ